MRTNASGSGGKAVLRLWRGAPSGVQDESRAPAVAPWAHVLASVLVAGATAYHIYGNYTFARSSSEARLDTIAGYRVFLISHHLQSRLEDAEAWSALPTFRAWLTLLADPNRPKLPHSPIHHNPTDFLRSLNSGYRFSGVFLVSSDERVLAATGNSASLGPEGLALCRMVGRDGMPRFAPLVGPAGKHFLGFVAPVRADWELEAAGEHIPSIVGVLAIIVDPASDLFPVFGKELLPTRTEETLLLWREGSEVVYFSPFSLAKGAGSPFRRSYQKVDRAVRSAFEGQPGSDLLTDYRGVPVLATVRAIPGTGWVLVEKIDRSEAFESYRQRALLETLAGALVILMFGVALSSSRHSQEADALRSRLQHQQDLLGVQRYARDVVDSVPAWLLVLSRDFRIQSANRSFLEYFSLRSDEVKGLPLGEIIHTQDLPHRLCKAEGRQTTTQDALLGVSVKGKETQLPARITVGDLIHATPGEAEVLLVVENLTESEALRLAAQAQGKALRESEDRYRDLVENSDDLLGTHDLEGTVLSANLAVARWSGFERAEDLIGLNIAQFLPPFLRPEFKPYLDTLRRDGRAHSVMRVVTRNGEERFLEYRNSLRIDGVEKPVVRCIGRDVTDRVRAQAALKQASQFRERVMENITNGIVVLDLKGRFTYLNRRAAEITGYSLEELSGKPFTVLLPTGKAGPLHDAIGRSLKDGKQILGLEIKIVCNDGSHRVIVFNLAPLYVGKAITAVVGSAEDITDRKKAEEDLRASEHSYRMLFERNLAGVFRTTPEGKVIDCNEAFARILGYDSRQEVLARSAWDLYPSRAERERFVAELRKARLLTNFECTLRRRDGECAWVLENSTWIEDVEGSVVIEGTLVDFGEFRRAQAARKASPLPQHSRGAGAGRSSPRKA